MTPEQRYQQDLEQGIIQPDPAQLAAIQALSQVHQALVARPESAESEVNTGFLSKLKAHFTTPTPTVIKPVQGLYMWGGVGRGKTYLMDCFFCALPFEDKLRVHFHRFMQQVHDDLADLKGQVNPLLKVADRFAHQARVICFDEFFVTDITDAMILAGLFEALFARGVSLVATSNIPPELLYRNGLQRPRFEPTIALIQQHCQVLNVDGGVDYRQRTLEQAEIYHYPLDHQADTNLAHYFRQLSSSPRRFECSIDINHRQLSVQAEADSVLQISFSELCEGPRSQLDYIELSRIYHTVLLSGVKVMDSSKEDAARRFIALIDEFYERNVTLIIAAEVAMEQLYQGKQLQFEFERCLSRLQEMQSKEYLSQEHLA